MTFSRVKPLGWATNEKLTSAQQNQLDEDHANAIDGDGGGSYTISGPLEIEGDDITLGATAGETITLGTDAAGALIVKAATEVQNGLQCTGSASCSFGGDVNITGTMVSGHLTTTGNTMLGNASSDTVTVAATSTFSAPVIFSAPGRARWTTATLTDSNANITPVTANAYYMPTGVLSAGRTLTIDDTNCGNGDWLWIFNADTVLALTVNGPGGSPTYHSISSAPADQCSLYLVRIGGTWRMVGLDYIS